VCLNLLDVRWQEVFAALHATIGTLAALRHRSVLFKTALFPLSPPG
jgi:hypothetical protein